MSQTDAIKNLLKSGPLSIKEIQLELDFLEPSIRRILGTETKSGTFERLGPGVYTLATKNDKQVAWVECGKAENVLPKLVDEGRKFDMVFMDPAYYSKAFKGGNRKIIDYDYMMPNEFGQAVKSVSKLMKTDDSHIYLMLAGSRTSQNDMSLYYDKMLDAGLKLVGRGSYTKLYKNGKPVINLRGEVASSENIFLFTKSGNARVGEKQLENLNFRYERPWRKYKTEKAPELLRDLILNSTNENDAILDPFAGSGVTGQQSVKLNRKCGMIEVSQEAVNNHIIPKLK
jgi:16S rRNA G966 N2-methylase RsmD